MVPFQNKTMFLSKLFLICIAVIKTVAYNTDTTKMFGGEMATVTGFGQTNDASK